MFFWSSSMSNTWRGGGQAEIESAKGEEPHLLCLQELTSFEIQFLDDGCNVRLLAIQARSSLWRSPTSICTSDENSLCALSAEAVLKNFSDKFALPAEGNDS
jgi:hypothetical protein